MIRGLALAAATSIFVVSAGSAVAAPTDVSEAATATKRAVRGDVFPTGGEPTPPPAPATAQYRVTLDFAWTPSTHPVTIPPASRRPHISAPVLATHSAPGALFALGTLASPGIEAMAERGSTGTLRSELNANGAVTSVSVGSPIFDVGSKSFDVTLTQSADLVSLVTMLAPSPDWFVGVRDVDLFADGAWIETITLDLGNYDSGTDSAPGFVHSNSDTNPAQPISDPRDQAFAAAASEGRFGKVTIARIP